LGSRGRGLAPARSGVSSSDGDPPEAPPRMPPRRGGPARRGGPRRVEGASGARPAGLCRLGAPGRPRAGDRAARPRPRGREAPPRAGAGGLHGRGRAAPRDAERRRDDVRGEPAEDRDPARRVRAGRAGQARPRRADTRLPQPHDPQLEQRRRERDAGESRRGGAHRHPDFAPLPLLRRAGGRRPVGRQALRQGGGVPARPRRAPLARRHRVPGRALLLHARPRAPALRGLDPPDEGRALEPRHPPQVREGPRVEGRGALVPQVRHVAAVPLRQRARRRAEPPLCPRRPRRRGGGRRVARPDRRARRRPRRFPARWGERRRAEARPRRGPTVSAPAPRSAATRGAFADASRAPCAPRPSCGAARSRRSSPCSRAAARRPGARRSPPSS
jgi:hypothetical protein